jgi:hypothetical protein
MTIKILLQNLETRSFFQGGIAWTKDVGSAFDFQTIEAAQQFWRENGLVRVRLVFVSCSAGRKLSTPGPLAPRRRHELQVVG